MYLHVFKLINNPSNNRRNIQTYEDLRKMQLYIY